MSPMFYLFHLLSVNVSFTTSDSAIASRYAFPIYKASFSLPVFVNVLNGVR